MGRASAIRARGAGTISGVPARIHTHREAAFVPERPRFLQPAEVADVLSITVSQVYTLMRSGQLPAVKIGKRGVWRVSVEALDAYIADLEREAEARRGA
jgi:excisionase family DNA binding protein